MKCEGGVGKLLEPDIKRVLTLARQTEKYNINSLSSGFGGLEVACWPLVPKFAGSNPAEAVGFLRANKNPQHVGGALMFVCCDCCVLSGRGLCDELITRSEESYRLWCVVECDLETS